MAVASMRQTDAYVDYFQESLQVTGWNNGAELTVLHP